MFITSPDRFAEWFKYEVPGAYREITAQDIRDMTDCGLIGHYRYYGRQEIEKVRAILQYEQMREKRIGRDDAKVVNSQPICRGCGQPLPDPPPEKKGRHGEYCVECQSSRSRERYRKWRKKRQA